MSATARTTVFLPPDFQETAEVVRDSLLCEGYRVESLNTKAKLCLASLHYQVRRGSQMDLWVYDFKAKLLWQIEPDKKRCAIHITVNSDNADDDKCREQVEAIESNIAEFASRHRTLTPDVPHNRYGSSDFATHHDLQASHWLISKPFDNKDHSRRFLIAAMQDQAVATPEQITQRHVLVSGPTGAGKTKSLFMPNLIERPNCSMLITEATADDKLPAPPCEIYRHTAGFRASQNSVIYSFNPADPTSTHINPLDRVSSAPPNQMHSSAKQLATLVIANTSNPYATSDPIWDRAERHLLYSLILRVSSDKDRPGSFADVLDLFIQGVSKLKEVFAANPQRPGRPEYDAFMNNADERFAKNVCSGLMTRLEPWWLPEVRELTAQTDFTREDIRKQLFTFYLSVSSLRDDYKLITTVIIDYLLNEFLEICHDSEYPISVMLDEIANLGRINRLPNIITTIRKTGIGLVFGVQDPAQILDLYGPAKGKAILAQPGTRIYFRPLQVEIARDISMALGKKTLINRTVRDNGRIEEREEAWPLMTESEIMELSQEEMIVFTPNTRPIKIKKFPWDKYKEHWDKDMPSPVQRDLIERPSQHQESPKHASTPVANPILEIAPDPHKHLALYREYMHRERKSQGDSEPTR